MRLSGGLLNRENPGLKHIRNLFLDLEKVTIQKAQIDDSDDSSDEAEEFEDVAFAARQANFTIRLLLDVIPVDTLECFRYNDCYFESPYSYFHINLSRHAEFQLVPVLADTILAGTIICESPSIIGFCSGESRNASRRSKSMQQTFRSCP